MTAARRARSTAIAWSLCAALALTLVSAPGALADPGTPGTPSASDVARARAAVAAAAAALRSASAAQATAERELRRLDARVELAVERWNAARDLARTARAALGHAQGVARQAQSRATAAQTDVDRLAVASYQVGADLSGGMGEWVAVLDSVFRPDGIQGLTDRVTAVGQVAADRQHDVTTSQVLRLRALQAQESAVRAAADLTERQTSVATAATAIRAEQSAQRSEVARLQRQRASASAALASRRSHASDLASQRASALAEQARARARAEAERKAREQARTHPTPRDPDVPTSPYPTGRSSTTRAQRLGALAYAKAQLGDPYVAGEAGPSAFDCSGLTSAAYRSVGVPMIQYSQAQFAAYEKIPVAQLQPGDLVFFAFDPADVTTIHHVGIYAGGGLMVEAPHTGDHVKYQTIWQDELVAFGTRP